MNVDVFGSKLHDAVIHEGILVTTSHTTKIMKLYSFEDILKNNMTEHFNIGDRIEGKGVIGQKPLGFPVNVKLKEEPPVLFSIMCEDFDVTFSEFVPTVCITTDKDYCYKVNNFIFIKKNALNVVLITYPFYRSITSTRLKTCPSVELDMKMKTISFFIQTTPED